MRIAITGATGYIGRRLIRAARLSGHDVLALSRRPVREPGVAWQPYDLCDLVCPPLPVDVAAVFHLAADTGNAPAAEPDELGAAQLLMSAADSVGATFVFVSSQKIGRAHV